MIDSENIPGLTVAAQMEQLAALGIEVENKFSIAGGMPPGMIAGMKPLGMYTDNSMGFVFDALQSLLPTIGLSLKLDFNEVANAPDSPSTGFYPILNIKP